MDGGAQPRGTRDLINPVRLCEMGENGKMQDEPLLPRSAKITEAAAIKKDMVAPKEGEDFYYEGSFLVFTANYHLKRGYCCNSVCRHCPYGDAARSQGKISGMTQGNPYASFLGDRDAFQVVRETPRRLRELVDTLGAGGLECSLGPGKWPVRSIISHLADCEIAFGFRLRQTMAIEDHTMQPFDQDKWARPYDSISGQLALEVFTALRGWDLALIKTLTAEDLARKANHPELGDLTLRMIVETMAGHDTNHLLQIEKIREQPR
jgi:Family of unknown function (DUF5522)/DinB superfamily